VTGKKEAQAALEAIGARSPVNIRTGMISRAEYSSAENKHGIGIRGIRPICVAVLE
jgi:hypothetical protein